MTLGSDIMNIKERSEHMKQQPLFQGMGFSRILDFSKEENSIRLEYIAEHRHCHSGNIAQGGYVTGWIDTTMAHLAMVSSEFSINPLTLELKVSFFKPANPGIVTTSAKIIKMGKSTAFIEGSLFDNEGNLLAKGSSSNRLIPNEKFPERNYK